MRTILGLSKTSTSIGWVLVDGRDVAGEPLDHDAFDIAGAGVAELAATARRARAIATATGYTVDCVRVTLRDYVDSGASPLRKALTESDFNVVAVVPLRVAAKAWANSIQPANGHQTAAVCILERESVSLSVIDTCNGAIKTMSTNSRDSADLLDWLTTALGRNGSQPESLYLIGSRAERDTVVGRLDEGLTIPVVATHDAQLALARGAVLADVTVEETVAEHRPRFVSHAKVLTVVAAIAVASVFTLSSAGSAIQMTENDFQQAATPSTSSTAATPTSAAPVAALVFPPPPAPEAEPVPEEPPPTPIRAPLSAETAVAPDTIAESVPEPIAVAPPVQHLPVAPPVQHLPDPPAVQHLPDPLAVQHLPEPQAGMPATGPDVPAPGPVALPPPPDPFAQVANPLLVSGLP